ncbi:hypothetical protein BJN34_12950 [Cupriavidus necator]|uniref:Uncharacterized protein n=1 Tax=Cupriavidus necator TaxID=106590 RepID=A0A1U9UQF1_CUPNE|nr:hypothetical protein [Cupriavidus necator]AQV94789.1 hypothetical protein BJN34_12950 [Cupriavidus necator]
MKLSERLLEIFDAKAAAERAQISKQASDIDALGEILSTAHYASVDLSPEEIVARGDRIQVYSGAPEEALAWMLDAGFSLQRTSRSYNYTHDYLMHPGIGCPVVILTDNAFAERP